jgi:hypothetical protein
MLVSVSPTSYLTIRTIRNLQLTSVVLHIILLWPLYAYCFVIRYVMVGSWLVHVICPNTQWLMAGNVVWVLLVISYGIYR